MLKIQQVKKLLNDPTISDEQALEIRDGFRSLAEIIFEQWERQQIKMKHENANRL